MVLLTKVKKPLAFLLGLMLSMMLVGCTSVTGLFFFPQKVWISTPDDFALQYQDVWLTTHDQTEIHGWWIPAAQQSTDTMVLFLHGNAENISSHARSVYWLAKQGVDVFALDYRGFGASQGKALLPAVYQDVEAAVIWLRQKQPNKKLVIVAQSIGTAIAVPFVAKAQHEYRIDALVLDAPFTRYGSVARSALSHSILGWVVWPFTVLVPTQFDPIKQAKNITIPVLVMHSPDDQVVPYKLGKKLYQHLNVNSSNNCWLDSRGAHIMSFAYPEIKSTTFEFITKQSCINTLP